MTRSNGEVSTARGALFATLPLKGDRDQIFELTPGLLPGELTAVTATAVFTLSREGRVTRKIPLSGGQPHFPVASVGHDGVGRARYVGVLNEKKLLALYGEEGELLRTMPCGSSARFAVGDVASDPGHEILVEMERGQGLAVFSRDGARLATIRAQGYLTAFHVAREAGAARDHVVLYTYPNEDRGGTFQVLTGDGTSLAAWRMGPISDFAVVRAETGEARLLYPQEDRLVLSSLRGQALAELNAPGVSFFARFAAQLSNGGLVVLGSGSGYRPYHALWIYDRTSRLRAMAVRKGHAYGFLVDALEDASILVGSESAVWRYSVPAPPRGDPSQRSAPP
jgi:hypothetical protein